jgi:hypothetical protein
VTRIRVLYRCNYDSISLKLSYNEKYLSYVVEKVKTQILFVITFFRKLCRVWHNVQKYYKSGPATDVNIMRRLRFACRVTKLTRAHTHTHTHTHTICNSYCFSAATAVKPTRLNVTSCVVCLSCFILLQITPPFVWAPKWHLLQSKCYETP